LVGLLLRAPLGHSNYLGYTGNRITPPLVACSVDNMMLGGLDGIYFRAGPSVVFGRKRMVYIVETAPLPSPSPNLFPCLCAGRD